jgi:peptide/nickel transport system permease protein
VRRLLLARVGQAALVVAFVVVGTFLLVRLAPGDPFTELATHPDMPAEVRETLLSQAGFSEPLLSQLVRDIGRAVRGDLGWSLSHSAPVTSVLARVVPATLLLMSSAILLALALGVALGAWQGWRPESWLARATHQAGIVVVAIPEFVLGLLLVLGPALTWGLFPTGRMRPAFPGSGLAGWVERLHHLALPTLALAIVLGAVVARHQRAAMLEVRGREFIRAARARGLPEHRILVAHALRNSLAPVLALTGIILPSLVGGTVLVESVFAWPGMGTTTLEAVRSRDYYLVVGTVLVSSIAVVLGTLAADLALLWADPRQRGRR